MKRHLLTTVLLLHFSSSFAQRIRFCNPANHWTNIEPYHLANPYALSPSTTVLQQPTVINGYTYWSVYTYREAGLVREDTSSGIVYFRYTSTMYGDTADQILYDYNCQLGDTIKRTATLDTFVHTITGIDSVLINNSYYKVWKVAFISGDYVSTDYYIIEGIGSNWGPTFSIYPNIFEWYSKLICFSDNSGAPLLNPPVAGYFDNDSSCTLATKEAQKHLMQTGIYPNPSANTVNITPGIAKYRQLVITDLAGKTVQSLTVAETGPIDISQLTRGIYRYTIIDEQHRTEKGKFIKE